MMAKEICQLGRSTSQGTFLYIFILTKSSVYGRAEYTLNLFTKGQKWFYSSEYLRRWPALIGIDDNVNFGDAIKSHQTFRKSKIVEICVAAVGCAGASIGI